MYTASIVTSAFLLISGIKDLKSKQISIIMTTLYLIGGIVYIISSERTVFPDVFLSLIPGILLIGLSIASRGNVGLGDAIVILALGLFFDASTVLTGLSLSLLLSSVYAGIIFARNRNRDSVFPFIPFIFLGYVSTFGLQYFLS